MATCAAATVTVTAVIGIQTTVGSRKDRHNIASKRRYVDELYDSIGDAGFRKVCRMDIISFCRLHKLLFGSDCLKRRKRGNGDIIMS